LHITSRDLNEEYKEESKHSSTLNEKWASTYKNKTDPIYHLRTSCFCSWFLS
jgi:hypothetical protein